MHFQIALLLFTLPFAALANEIPMASTWISVCDRSEVVKKELERITQLDCKNITAREMAGITKLELNFVDINAVNSNLAQPIYPNDFKNLPSLIDLKMTGGIRVLPKGLFDEIPNLMALSLDYAQIENLPEGIFAKLQRLVGLSLLGNKLKAVKANWFGEHPELLVLVLAFNQIEYLDNFSFASMRRLWLLNLSFNQIKTVSHSNLEGLTKLLYFDLSRNPLQGFADETFSNVTKLSYLNLAVTLEGEARKKFDRERVGLRNKHLDLDI